MKRTLNLDKINSPVGARETTGACSGVLSEARILLLLILILTFASAPVLGQGSASVTPAAARRPVQWPYRFSAEQIQELQASGCTFDGAALRVARRMEARGFSAKQYVQAYRDLWELGAIHGGIMLVEKLAVLRYLGLTKDQYGRFSRYFSKGVQVTEFYNKHVIGGRGQNIAGWIMFGVGAAFTLGGSLLGLAMEGACYEKDDDCKITMWTSAATIFVPAGIVTLVGLPLGISGSVKTARWAPTGLLDEGNTLDMLPYRLDLQAALDSSSLALQTNTPKLALSPYFTGDGGGLGLHLQF